MASKRKDLPLRARVVQNVLTIEIGIDTLAFSTLRSPYAYEIVGGAMVDTDDPTERFRIDDKRVFAIDVVREMLNEEEDGSSPLSDFLDDVCKRAIEEGSTEFTDKDKDNG